MTEYPIVTRCNQLIPWTSIDQIFEIELAKMKYDKYSVFRISIGHTLLNFSVILIREVRMKNEHIPYPPSGHILSFQGKQLSSRTTLSR